MIPRRSMHSCNWYGKREEEGGGRRGEEGGDREGVRRRWKRERREERGEEGGCMRE
jgi:hypothetical protein